MIIRTWHGYVPLKHAEGMKWILLMLTMAVSGGVAGEKSHEPPQDRSFEPPEIRCLNDQTLPFIQSERDARKVVDDAFAHCRAELETWKSMRSSLPQDMQAKQYHELHDFYVRLIDIRRRAESNTTP